MNNKYLNETFGLISEDDIDEVQVEIELSLFINEQIGFFNPDLIIVVERKATAIFRALKEIRDLNFNWPWSKVISSSALDQLDMTVFKDKRILIFDDMMMTGHHLKGVVGQLAEFSVTKENLWICAFGVHQKATDLKLADAWFYYGLTDYSYQYIRKRIVNLLERTGSLLLDTEHIELRFKLGEFHFGSIINFLNQTGRACVYSASKNRKNVTVYYGSYDSTENYKSSTSNPIFQVAVKKCRVVQRSVDEFAIIPIWYPVVPDDSEFTKDKAVIEYLFDGHLPSNKDNSGFYAVGLVAAIEVLNDAIKDLISGGFDSSLIKFPLTSDEDISSDFYTLNHLHVMFPDLNISRLNQFIYESVRATIAKGHEVKTRRRHKELKFINATSDQFLYKNAASLLQLIRRKIDLNILDEADDSLEPLRHPNGLMAQEVFDLASRLNQKTELGSELLTSEKVSSLFDILIDNGCLVTHVEPRKVDDKTLFVRTFEPDGEIVSNFVRRYYSMHGLPIELDL